MRIEDQGGVRWKVDAHDPASQYVNRLKRLGFGYVVLPRLTFMSGALIDEAPPADAPLVRSVRLADCLAVLKGDV